MTLGNTVVFLKADMLPETLGEIDAKTHRNTLGDVDTVYVGVGALVDTRADTL